jgi:hypothetical protein
VDVTVVTPGGTSATGAADQFTYIVAPGVTGISPSSGPATGGTSVTITGTNFTGATAVRFGGSNAGSFTVNSSTQITASAPAGSGTVDVTVVTPGGTSATGAADQFSYSVRQTGLITTAMGGGTVQAEIVSGSAGCSIDLVNSVAFTPPPYQGVTPPYGGLRLRIVGCDVAGETVRVSVTWPTLAGLAPMNYGPTPTSGGRAAWYLPSNLTIAGNVISYDIVDGGLGDDTFGPGDGIINDPVALVASGAAPAAQAVPFLSSAMMGLLAGLLGLFGMRSRHRRVPRE